MRLRAGRVSRYAQRSPRSSKPSRRPLTMRRCLRPSSFASRERQAEMRRNELARGKQYCTSSHRIRDKVKAGLVFVFLSEDDRLSEGRYRSLRCVPLCVWPTRWLAQRQMQRHQAHCQSACFCQCRHCAGQRASGAGPGRKKVSQIRCHPEITDYDAFQRLKGPLSH